MIRFIWLISETAQSMFSFLNALQIFKLIFFCLISFRSQFWMAIFYYYSSFIKKTFKYISKCWNSSKEDWMIKKESDDCCDKMRENKNYNKKNGEISLFLEMFSISFFFAFWIDFKGYRLQNNYVSLLLFWYEDNETRCKYI